MGQVIPLRDYLAAVRGRAEALGLISEELTEKMRNSGENRTSEKREMLAAIEARALAAGLVPLPANY